MTLPGHLIPLLREPFIRGMFLITLVVAVAFPLYEVIFVYPRFERLQLDLIENNAERAANHLSHMLAITNGDGDGQLQLPVAFPVHVQGFIDDFGLEDLSLYDHRGRILYSSEEDEGTGVNEHAYFFRRVAAGEVFSVLIRDQGQNLEGRVLHTDMVETYVPVMREGQFLGAFEVYSNITHEQSRLSALLKHASADLFGLAVILLALVIALIVRAGKELERRREAQRELKESEALFRSMTTAANAAIIMSDNVGRATYWNPAAERIFGYCADEVLGKELHTLIVPPESLAFYQAGFNRFAESGEGPFIGSVELTALRKGEVEFPVEISLSPVHKHDGWHALAIVHDISVRKRNENDLRLAQRVMEYSLEGIVVTNAQGMIEQVNPAFSELTGYTLGEVRGKFPSVLSSGRHNKRFYQKMWYDLQRHGAWQGEIWNRRKDGSLYPEWLSISAVKDSNGHLVNYVGIFSDISQFKAHAEDLARLAQHDPLTDLPNRLLLWDRLEQAIKHCQRHGMGMSVLFLDLDHFKPINDAHGHAVGDIILQLVAQRLIGNLRDEDTVARMGGDEFVILLPGTYGQTDAASIAADILTIICAPYTVADQEHRLGASIGISQYPHDTTNTKELVELADRAMYRAKKAGRNRFTFAHEAVDNSSTD